MNRWRIDSSMTDYLADMQDAGIAVNWLTLLLGLDGPGKFAPALALSDVERFATNRAVSSPGSEGGAMEIVAALDGGIEETRAALQRLAGSEKGSAERELRKWRVVLLRQAMSHLPSDPVYGLIALTEFWEQFDFPLDSPHVVQGRGNTLSPADYYTEANFRALVQKHWDWIDREIAALSPHLMDREPHST